MLDIIDYEQEFYDEFEYFCYKACYFNILKFYGIKNPELYLNYTMRWMIHKNDNLKWGFTFSFGDSNDGLKKIFDKNIIKINNQVKDETSIWEINKKWIELGMPVVAGVDVYYLQYTPYYQKKHAIHSLIVCGYEKEMAKIIDWYPDWFFKGEIKREELDCARRSKNDADGILSGVPIQYESIVIKKDINKCDDVNLIINTISEALKEFYSIKTNDFGFFCGYNALCELGKILEKNEYLGSGDKYMFLKYLFENVYFVPSRKKLFLWFIRRVENINPSFQAGRLTEMLKKSIDGWKIFLSLLTKCMINDKKSEYTKILLKFKEILDIEKEFYYELYKFENRIRIITRRPEL